ncbi:hypothetical protein DFS34DRAFT_464676 [Phlyctochytrium arcticum]|nr:hypothetical protein DFS34DRAFT_464676 [Phlyctochytrium arcticum]
MLLTAILPKKKLTCLPTNVPDRIVNSEVGICREKLMKSDTYMGHNCFLMNTFWVPAPDRRTARLLLGESPTSAPYIATFLGKITYGCEIGPYGSYVFPPFPGKPKLVIALTDTLLNMPHADWTNMVASMNKTLRRCPLGDHRNQANFNWVRPNK